MKITYGADPSQLGELHLPAGTGPVPVVVVVHGGYWRAAYGYDLGTPLAADLANRGVAAWNIEYRRVGDGGGWPATFLDVAAAVDALAGAVQDAAGGRLDLNDVRAVGHSAGGHLAVWAAGRPSLPAGAPGAGPAVRLTRVVSQAGVLDLVGASELGLGGGASDELLGGPSAAQPERYALASPLARLPIGRPVTCVHGDADVTVPISQSETYVAAATATGDPAVLVTLPGVDHFALIDVSTTAWAACRDALLG
ncbi:S9 family peptidase [Rhodococcus antarcticus]|uniref:S9 family peptidase n=1 Tax=Rhodococcus antarcticus TaxID=2987751 RepID=A0ABY6P4P0_9NOCA|nr:prolyl oligopeptidase family serine peptidase [Rhodococcus antarcticus]UZJ26630.1 S9 family peptidase [Rhodococcus antarcticus]